MKIVCQKSDLVSAINIVMKAVPSKTTMSILECVLIDASANEIKLTANDMELGIETKVEGNIIEKGVVAIEARVFSDIVRKLPENDIAIDVSPNFETLITCEKAKFSILGKPGEDFSYLPFVEKDHSVYLSQFTLREMIRQTIFSVADNDSNRLMTGELFEIHEDELKIVALDGHRIAIRKVELKDSFGDMKVIVPGKTLSEISKILTGGIEDEVQISFTKNHIVFEFDETIVVSRLIEGEYFRIDQMLSSDYNTRVVINKRELLDCIDRATLLIKEGDKKPIILYINDHTMELKIQSFIGSMDEEIDIEKEGKDIVIGFNPKFLIDALRVIDDEQISMYLVNPKAPCFIRDDEGKYIYLVLPVQIVAA